MSGELNQLEEQNRVTQDAMKDQAQEPMVSKLYSTKDVKIT